MQGKRKHPYDERPYSISMKFFPVKQQHNSDKSYYHRRTWSPYRPDTICNAQQHAQSLSPKPPVSPSVIISSEYQMSDALDSHQLDNEDDIFGRAISARAIIPPCVVRSKTDLDEIPMYSSPYMPISPKSTMSLEQQSCHFEYDPQYPYANLDYGTILFSGNVCHVCGSKQRLYMANVNLLCITCLLRKNNDPFSANYDSLGPTRDKFDKTSY